MSNGQNLGQITDLDFFVEYVNEFRSLLRSFDTFAATIKVLDTTILAEPNSPSADDAYLLPTGSTPTGTNWAGNAGTIAVWRPYKQSGKTNIAAPSWDFYPIKEGWVLYSVAQQQTYQIKPDLSIGIFGGSTFDSILVNGESDLYGDVYVGDPTQNFNQHAILFNSNGAKLESLYNTGIYWQPNTGSSAYFYISQLAAGSDGYGVTLESDKIALYGGHGTGIDFDLNEDGIVNLYGYFNAWGTMFAAYHDTDGGYKVYGSTVINDSRIATFYGVNVDGNSGYYKVSGATVIDENKNGYFENIKSGTYTPTLTNITNITSSTPSVWTWLRDGNAVTVSGSLDFQQTANGSFEIQATLPIASNITSQSEAGGIGSSSLSGDAFAILGGTGNVRLLGNDNDHTNHTHSVTFTYRIV